MLNSRNLFDFTTVSPDNFYRRLKQKLNLQFVRPLAKDFSRTEKSKPVHTAGGRQRH
jgi:hypothetical protein